MEAVPAPASHHDPIIAVLAQVILASNLISDSFVPSSFWAHLNHGCSRSLSTLDEQRGL